MKRHIDSLFKSEFFSVVNRWAIVGVALEVGIVYVSLRGRAWE